MGDNYATFMQASSHPPNPHGMPQLLTISIHAYLECQRLSSCVLQSLYKQIRRFIHRSVMPGDSMRCHHLYNCP